MIVSYLRTVKDLACNRCTRIISNESQAAFLDTFSKATIQYISPVNVELGNTVQLH